MPGARASAPAASGAGAGTPATDPAAAESKKLQELFDGYFEEYLALNPLLATSIGDPRYNDRFEVSISPDWRARNERLQRGYLERIKDIEPGRLGPQDRISYEVFRSAREMDIEGLRFPDYLIPLNQFYSVPNTFVQLGSGTGLQPFKTVQDYDAFLKRVDGLVAWSDQAIVNMREGVAKGYTLPRVLAERVLPQLESQVVARPEDSSFWGPIRNMPQDFPAADRERLTAAYRSMIETKIFPTYRRLHDFVRDEYLPKCRDTVGLGALPDGKAWYAYNVREITTTDYTPEQIHAMGLAEVARIHDEMRKVMKQVGFKGDLDAFFDFMKTDPRFFYSNPAELIQGYVDIKNRVDPNLPRLFDILPKSDYEVRAVEPFREKSASGGAYQAASEDGSRPGIFYANTYDMKSRPKWAMEALSLHEGNPGHHFQISIQREQQDLPKFRRFGGYTVLLGRLGSLRGITRQAARHVPGPVPVLRHARGRTVAGDPARRGHRPAREGLDAPAGARLHGCEQCRGRSTARVRGGALHGDSRPGRRLQDRAAQDPGTARKGRTRARAALRPPQVPHRGAGKRRAAAARAAG